MSVLLYYLFFLLFFVEERRTRTTAASRSILGDNGAAAADAGRTRIEGQAAAERLPQPNEHDDPRPPLPILEASSSSLFGFDSDSYAHTISNTNRWNDARYRFL